MIAYSYFFTSSNWSAPGIALILLAFLIYQKAFQSSAAEKGYFIAAGLLIYFALGSPLPSLSDFGLHSVAMLQQFFILMIAPVFLLKSIPAHSRIAEWLARYDFSGTPSRAVFCWIIGAIAMWGGHFLSAAILSSKTGVAICGLALSQNNPIGRIPESLVMGVLLIGGLLFSLPVFHPRRSNRIAALISVMYLFTACISCSVLGLYVAFSASSAAAETAVPFFTTLRNPVPMTLRTDQEVAGMLMWVPGCIFYVVASMGILENWYSSPRVTESISATENKKNTAPTYRNKKSKIKPIKQSLTR